MLARLGSDGSVRTFGHSGVTPEEKSAAGAASKGLACDHLGQSASHSQSSLLPTGNGIADDHFALGSLETQKAQHWPPELLAHIASRIEQPAERATFCLVSRGCNVEVRETIRHINPIRNRADLHKAIALFPNLESLDLSRCEGLTKNDLAQLVALKSLTSLKCEGCNSLTTLPAAIGELKSLRTLNLRDCPNLTSLPKEIGELSNLQTLNLKRRQTSGNEPNLAVLPREIGKLTELRSLDLQGTNITDAVLANLTSLTNLRYLGLRNCMHITDRGMPHLISLTELQEANVAGTEISADVLRELNLKHLDNR